MSTGNYDDFTIYEEKKGNYNMENFELSSTYGGLYRLYKSDDKSIFTNEIENFLLFSRNDLKRDEKKGEKKCENNNYHYHYYHHDYTSFWPFWYYPPMQPVNVININESKEAKNEVKEEEKKEKNEFDLVGKILLSAIFLVIGGFLTFDMTYDYADYKLYEDGMRKRKKCKEKMKEVKKNNALSFVNRDVTEIDEIIEKFAELYQSRAYYRKVKVFSKISMGIIALGEIIGGLYAGPGFYGDKNIFYFTLIFSVPMGTYIFNRVQYYLSGGVKDNMRIKLLNEKSDKLLKSEEFKTQPAINPEVNEKN